MNFQLDEVFLNVIQTSVAFVFGTLACAGLIGAEKRDQRIFYVAYCQFENVRIFPDEAQVEDLKLG
jgi:hypothetical protein